MSMSPPTSEGSADVAGLAVWVIGINYAPDAVGIAPYTTQLVEHLHEAGARVHVTTGIPHYPSWQVADGYRWRPSTRERINGVPVQRFRHYVPGVMTSVRRAVYEATFLLQVLRHRAPFAPDLVLGVTPALSGAVAGAIVSRRHRAPLMVIVQDLVGPGVRQSGMSKGKNIARLIRRAEKWALRQASAVTILHDGFRQYVLRSGVPESDLHVVRNWSYAVPAATPRDEARRQLGWPEDETVVLYAGNMGLKMGLENVVDAGRLAGQRAEKLRFVLLGDGSQRSVLESYAAGATQVQFAASRYGSDFADALAAADVLLVNERPGVRNMSLPSKLAYYFTSGRPVLAAAAEDGTTAKEIAAAGAGEVVESGDPAALLDAALALVAEQDHADAMGRSAQAYAADEYDRSRILARVTALVGDTARRRAPRRIAQGAEAT